ncbi:preprotein translocase subunit YajC [Curtobacterium ammoniigenes]|uniref:preprotein translocase subunit YajC n=1 Tax=Curtobacterium ammoniigenes TaxID=395387 RepID=UPI000831FC26|nr:preprotein translocase subunit YajC [Curtobacterium ammoniigenes]
MNILLIVILVGFAAFLFWNSRKRKKQQAEMALQMVPGARVMLSFGLYGRLISINEEQTTADVEIAPGTTITVHRQTLARVVEEPTDTPIVDADAPVVAPEPLAETTEPEYGERADSAAEIDAAKRANDD